MKALAVTGVKEMELQTIKKPIPEEEEVLIRVSYVGVCGSDLPRYFDGGVHQFPQILGHEFSGIVEQCGGKVSSLKVGDRVVVAPLIPCGKCNQCMSGHPQLCPNYSFIGSRRQGAMAEFVAVPEQNCLVIPRNVSLKIAAMVEPLTVALHGVDQIRFKSGTVAMVLGAGTIGLMTILALRARGVGQIIAVDLNDARLETAKELGADIVINPLTDDLLNYFVKNELPEIVFETAGNHITQVQAVDLVQVNGQIVYIGTSTKEVTFKPEEFELILRKELLIRGAWMSYSAPFPGSEWTSALEFLSKKIINPEKLITGLYKLEDRAKPFEDMVKKNSMAIKVLYEIGGEDIE